MNPNSFSLLDLTYYFPLFNLVLLKLVGRRERTDPWEITRDSKQNLSLVALTVVVFLWTLNIPSLIWIHYTQTLTG